jgi:hypothetical protein
MMIDLNWSRGASGSLRLQRALPLAVGLFALGGCDSSEPSGTCTVNPPTTWTSSEWDANTAEAMGLRANLDALTGTSMRAAEEGTGTVDMSSLDALFAEGDPSLETITSAAYVGVVKDAFAEFVELVAAGPVDVVGADGAFDPGTAGGVFGSSSRGVNEGGLEVRQIVDKGVFAGAGLYRYAAGLTTGPIDAATIDAIAAAWGANSALDGEGELTDSANYGQRMGYHAASAQALIAARAYAADPGCASERDEAIRTHFELWEESMFARFTFYLNAAVGLSTDAASDDDIADAIHELSEGLGLAAGFHGLDAPVSGPLSGSARAVTDADIEKILTALGVDLSDLGASTTGDIVVDPAAFGAAQDEVEATLTEAFDLTEADLASWLTPTAG